MSVALEDGVKVFRMPDRENGEVVVEVADSSVAPVEDPRDLSGIVDEHVGGLKITVHQDEVGGGCGASPARMFGDEPVVDEVCSE